MTDTAQIVDGSTNSGDGEPEEEQAVGNHDEAVHDLHRELADLHRQLREKDNQLIGMEYRLRSMQQRLDTVFSSLSWRVTAPLRTLSDFVARHTGVHVHSNINGTHDVAYEDWAKLYDTLTDEDRSMIRDHIALLPRRPLISVILPVYNTPEKWLRLAIESVVNQLYPNWELCIADDASTAPHVRQVLEEFLTRDSRIKVTFRDQNGHICKASNSALELASGEFVALLDHDDELSEHALYLVAFEINKFPDADIIYSDEDKIDEEGKRYHHFFKPDWNPDFFYSVNYVCHLGVYRRSLVESIGGFREGFEGSQDYDLCIRCAAETSPEHIRHIPFVLYHWRAIKGSTALSTSQKAYAEKAAVRALKDHFQRIDPNIDVSVGKCPTTYIIRYPLPEPQPLVSIIIPSRDHVDLLRRCVTSISGKTTYKNYEILIVDNGSTDPAAVEYLAQLGKQPRFTIMRHAKEFNFSEMNNLAARNARGQVLALLNNDLEVISPEWLTDMVRHVLRPGVGAVGAKLFYPNRQVQHAGIRLGMGGTAGHSHHGCCHDDIGYWGRLVLVQDVAAVTAACLVVKKELFEQVGGLDEEHLPVAFNDVDFCLKLFRAGYRNVLVPQAKLFHHESRSRGYENTPEKRDRFARETQFLQYKWNDLLMKDPFYNPNLALDASDFTLAAPPRIEKPWLTVHGANNNADPE